MAQTSRDGGSNAIPKGYVPVPRGTKGAVPRRVQAETGRTVTAYFRPKSKPAVRPIRVSNDSRASLLGEQALRRDPARLARGIDLTKNPRLRRAIDRKVNGPKPKPVARRNTGAR